MNVHRNYRSSISVPISPVPAAPLEMREVKPAVVILAIVFQLPDAQLPTAISTAGIIIVLPLVLLVSISAIVLPLPGAPLPDRKSVV